jgi:hypothetical protein
MKTKTKIQFLRREEKEDVSNDAGFEVKKNLSGMHIFLRKQ